MQKNYLLHTAQHVHGCVRDYPNIVCTTLKAEECSAIKVLAHSNKYFLPALFHAYCSDLASLFAWFGVQ